MLRLMLFAGTNLAVLLVLSVTSRVLGLDQWLATQGMQGQMTGLLIMAGLFGFGGSFISLALSKFMAKRSMGVQLIEQPSTPTERWLIQTVERQARQAGIEMPEVGIFQSPTPNAFATGMNKNAALVAVSTGLLQHMNQDEVEAVLGHEVSHVANGDMVTMGLIQGVLNTFVIFFARIIGLLIDSALRGNQQSRGPGIGYWVASIAAEMVLGILAAFVSAWFSRYREFHADAGGAQLAGRQKMISALRALQRVHEPSALPEQFAAFGILGGGLGPLGALLRTHPPLEDRIRALEHSEY